MKPFCASILPLLVTLTSACSSSQAPTSIAPTNPASASFAAASSGNLSVVTRTDEGDNGADGTVDGRQMRTTWYDAHGNPTKSVLERTLPAGDAARSTTAYEYNARGAQLGYVEELDNGADGTVDSRGTLQTVDTDNRGNPIRQVFIQYDGNGHETGRIDVVNTFDARSRILIRTLGPERTSYEYDSHDNITGAVVEVRGSLKTVSFQYTIHDALVHGEEILMLNGTARTLETTSTVEYDKSGYPTRQVIEDTHGTPNRTSRVLGYDSWHRLFTQTDNIDFGENGSLDFRAVSTWEYSGGGPDTPANKSPSLTVPAMAGFEMAPRPVREASDPVVKTF